MPSPRLPRGSATPRFAQRAIALAILVLLALTRGSAQTGQLIAVTPTGASSLVSVNITGSGFHATASNNEVSFVPTSGATVVASATAVMTADASRDLRRLTVRVPAGLPVGATALRVTNTATGATSEGLSVQIITIDLGNVVSAPVGATGVAVRITGSPNAQFASNNTRVLFGAGVTVSGTDAGLLSASPGGRPLNLGKLSRSSGRLELTAGQLLINQRISQAAVRRLNAIRARIDLGLVGEDFQAGTVTGSRVSN